MFFCRKFGSTVVGGKHASESCAPKMTSWHIVDLIKVYDFAKEKENRYVGIIDIEAETRIQSRG